jgi:hypothetical protein
MLSIEADPQWVQAKLSEVKRLALPGEGALADGERPLELPESNPADENEDHNGNAQEESGPTGADPEDRARPYPPERLKQRVLEVAEGHRQEEAPFFENQRQIIARHLSAIFDGDESKRYRLCEWLLGGASAKEIEPALVLACLDWLGTRRYEDPPLEVAGLEAQAALEFASKAGEQIELEMT